MFWREEVDPTSLAARRKTAHFDEMFLELSALRHVLIGRSVEHLPFDDIPGGQVDGRMRRPMALELAVREEVALAKNGRGQQKPSDGAMLNLQRLHRRLHLPPHEPDNFIRPHPIIGISSQPVVRICDEVHTSGFLREGPEDLPQAAPRLREAPGAPGERRRGPPGGVHALQGVLTELSDGVGEDRLLLLPRQHLVELLLQLQPLRCAVADIHGLSDVDGN
mmetsp:Transcript_12644/g.34094  ORF Transcript_12644/g.34094 Transcript_12644/m.34094 type:complete len:221 (-) Transcript_12644:671-1333(-)